MTTTGTPTSTSAGTPATTSTATPGSAAAWTVQEIPAPSSLQDDDAWGIHARAALDRAVQLDAWGHADLAQTADAILTALREREYAERTHLLVTHPDRPREAIGAAYLRAPRTANTHMVEAELLVHPDHRRRGVGSALLAAAERWTRAKGRRLLVLETDHGTEPPADDPGAILPPTGVGRISHEDSYARFVLRHGMTLEQAERYSVLRLPVDPAYLEGLRAQAEAAAGPDYRVVTWRDRCPDEWVDGLAVCVTRMSTDAPTAGLEWNEDPWDAARIRTAEDMGRASGQGFVVTAVVHELTGTLAGYTELEFTLDEPEAVHQGDTIVLREHRGHRLGQLIKAVNLDHLAAIRPDARRVHTWNAEENGYMLQINVELGFRPAGVCGVWTKALA